MATTPSTLFDEDFLHRLEILAVVSKKVTPGATRADRRTRRRGAGIEFADHRDYTPGDDLRALDWSLFGRLDRLLIRLFEEDEDLSLYLLVDSSASMAQGAPRKLDLVVRVAAALAYAGLANLDRVALYAMAETLREGLPPGRGRGRLPAILSFLEAASAAPGGRTSLRAAAAALVHRHRRRGLVIVLSDFYDPEGSTAGLDLLRYHRFEPVVVQILGPDDTRPDLRGDLTLCDSETGEEREVTVSGAVLDAYARRHAELCRGLDRYCRERGIPAFRATSDVAYDDLVLRIFREGGLLA